MANKTIYVDAIVDDKGTIAKVAVSAKVAGAALKDLKNNAGMTDHAMKGVGQQSSNATKNFSKMAESINGGLVPAYATLAAQLFAVSAAYQFLKSAGDLKVLKEGQVAYASATGMALRSLTNDIIAATDAQISFTDASQAAAIGISSGLSPDQMVAIGKAAKDASIILGRDVTDSFNRLTRGITKAEPELLDELGIILRLETATTKYANTLGKSAKDLTAFERSQAVANEVLSQAEDKYGAILAIVDPAPNKFAQLGIAVDKLLNQIKLFVGEVAGPLADVLIRFPQLIFIAFAVLLKKVVAAALPGLGSLEEATSKMAASAQARMAKVTAGVEEYRASLVKAALANRQLTAANAASSAQTYLKGMSLKPGSGFEKLQQGNFAAISSQNLTGMIAAVKSNSAQFKSMSASNRAAFEQDLRAMLLATKKDVSQIDVQFKTLFANSMTGMQRLRLMWANTMNAMVVIAQRSVKFINMALSAIGWVTLVFTMGALIYNFLKAEDGADSLATSLSMLTDKVTTLNEEFKLFDLIQQELNQEGNRTLGFLHAFGQRIGSLGIGQTRNMLTNLSEGMETYSASIADANANLERAIRLADRLQKGNPNSSRLAGAREEINRYANSSTSSFSEYIKTQGTDEQKVFVQYLEDQVKSLENSGDQFAANTKVFKNYIGSIKTFLSSGGSPALIDQIVQQQVEVGRLTELLGGLSRQQSDNIDAADALMRAFMPDTGYDRAINTLRIEYESLTKVLDEVQALGDLELKTRIDRMVVINRQIALFKDLNEQEHRNNILREQSKSLEIRSLIGATPGQSALIKQEVEARNLAIERNDLERTREQIIRAINEKQGQDVELEFRNLQMNSEKLVTLEAQEASLARQRDLLYQIGDAANAAFEGALQGGIAAVIKGEETSLKDAVLKIAQATVSSVAESLSKQITDKIMGRSPAQIAAKQAMIISNSFLDAGREVAVMISNAIKGVPVSTSSTPINTSFPSVSSSSRSGGLMSLLKSAASFILPGLVPFATGGVVHRPTAAMIGEGKYSEAVVPLPDGKRIPVALSGSGGQNNNVEINIVMENGSATSSTSGNNMDSNALGNAIAKAVQRELQNQKRSGGILSPFGTA